MKTKTLALIVLPLAMAYAASGFAEKGEEIISDPKCRP